MPKTDWNPLLRGEFVKPYWLELQEFVENERARTTVYPPADDVFAALHLTPFADVKVVILGQDMGVFGHAPYRMRPPRDRLPEWTSIAGAVRGAAPNIGRGNTG